MLQAGYYCSVCECILRDSQSYLDHINGKFHNRALGMSMRVERSTANDVTPPLPHPTPHPAKLTVRLAHLSSLFRLACIPTLSGVTRLTG